MAARTLPGVGAILTTPHRPLPRWWRSRLARDTADFLDRLVDAELEFLRRLPVHLRSRPAEVLATLVILAQDHRYHAQGRIGRQELRRRSERALSDLDALRVRFDLDGPAEMNHLD